MGATGKEKQRDGERRRERQRERRMAVGWRLTCGHESKGERLPRAIRSGRGRRGISHRRVEEQDMEMESPLLWRTAYEAHQDIQICVHTPIRKPTSISRRDRQTEERRT